MSTKRARNHKGLVESEKMLHHLPGEHYHQLRKTRCVNLERAEAAESAYEMRKVASELLNDTPSYIISQLSGKISKIATLPKMNFPKATITGMNGKQFVEYLTPFKDDVGDDVTFVYDTDIKAYTDDAYCMYELTNAGIDDDYQRRIMQKVADEYGCEFSNDELLSNDSTVLLQAILAVYAWLKLKEMD